jgi:hypothetical protein
MLWVKEVREEGVLDPRPSKCAARLILGRFLPPLVAFVASIGVTNVVSAFTETTLHRAGMGDQLTVDLCGAGFQLSIVLGGIVVGGCDGGGWSLFLFLSFCVDPLLPSFLSFAR